MSRHWVRLRSCFGLLALLSACAVPEPGPHTSQTTFLPSAAPERQRPALMTGTGEVSPDPASEPAPRARPAAPRAPTEAELKLYAWLDPAARIRVLEETIAPPEGFTRVVSPEGSFGAFLRRLPLRPEGAPVNDYNGGVLREPGDPRIAAVVEVDVSKVDLQQCADSVIRMHAEWLWSKGDRERIGYHFLGGDFAAWPRYSSGVRPLVERNKVQWVASAKSGADHATFRKYLDMVFMYASTISLDKRSSTPIDRSEIAPGDFFVLPGGPGHAILILDVATSADGKRVALLGQGYMPAQDFQVLVPPGAQQGPWFSLEGADVDTPFWPVPFPWSSLRRMK